MVENTASTGSPGMARTASTVIYMPLAAHCAVTCLSLLAGPWPGLARTSHPGTMRPYQSMAVMSGPPRSPSGCRRAAADARRARSAQAGGAR